mmetsp:Transcript_90426/g.242175  ORF Transcript_90426/g.242175 Transcript_90426/m.242175 type:complete len:202 (+) Transcript_90426:209-814(+)
MIVTRESRFLTSMIKLVRRHEPEALAKIVLAHNPLVHRSEWKHVEDTGQHHWPHPLLVVHSLESAAQGGPGAIDTFRVGRRVVAQVYVANPERFIVNLADASNWLQSCHLGYVGASKLIAARVRQLDCGMVTACKLGGAPESGHAIGRVRYFLVRVTDSIIPHGGHHLGDAGEIANLLQTHNVRIEGSQLLPQQFQPAILV